MDGTRYTNKCFKLLQTKQLIKLNHDPTKSIESKVKCILRKLKNRLSSKEYYQLHPTGSCPGKFYTTAKIHKLPANWFIDNVPLRSIVSNIGTASYQLAKSLAKLLFPLVQSNYRINSTKDVTIKIKMKRFQKIMK